jgi:hypothetical protein
MRRFSLTCIITFRHFYYPWTSRKQANGWTKRFRHCRRCGAVQAEWFPPPGYGLGLHR